MYRADAITSYQLRHASESRVERIATQIIRDERLATRVWEHEDERTDVLTALAFDAAKNNGLDDCQQDYLRQLLRDA